ncbi:hypothetical protein KC644_01545, partial [Candidatus Berkelbacteria bacterium]|nr:hypothetical protein [Candidatus Berkelbacteria bacterium]
MKKILFGIDYYLLEKQQLHDLPYKLEALIELSKKTHNLSEINFLIKEIKNSKQYFQGVIKKVPKLDPKAERIVNYHQKLNAALLAAQALEASDNEQIK